MNLWEERTFIICSSWMDLDLFIYLLYLIREKLDVIRIFLFISPRNMLLLDTTLPNLVIIDSSPITHLDIGEMIDELRGAPILKGARGHKPSDISAVIEVLLRLSQLLIDFPEIRELDINPLRLFQKNHGCRVLDARIMVR